MILKLRCVIGWNVVLVLNYNYDDLHPVTDETEGNKT